MIKIAYKDLRQEAFRMAMVKLSTCTEYGNIKVSYNIMRMAKALEKEMEISQKLWNDLTKKLIQRDEKGNFKITDGKFVWVEGVEEAAADKELKEFGELVVDIDRFQLPLSSLLPAKLSPSDLASLEPILLLDVDMGEGESKVLKQVK